MSGGPNSYIIFTDPCLTGSKNIYSIEPVAAGEYVGPTDSENDNRGSLVATMQGKYVEPGFITLTDEDKKFDFRVQVAGGINGGTWAHRPNKTSTVGTIVSDKVGSSEITVGTQLVVNDVETPLTRYKDPYTPLLVQPATSALAKAIAINENTELHGVTATGNAAEIVFDVRIAGGTLDNGELVINDVDLLNGAGPVAYVVNDGTSTLRNAINAHTGTHGITASTVSTGSTGTDRILVLTGTDVNLDTGASLGLFVDAAAAAGLGWTGATATIHRAGITLSSNTHIDLRPSSDISGVLGINSEIIFRSQIAGGTIFSGQLLINDFDLVGPGPFVFTTNDGTSALRNAINARTSIHGITASLDGTTRLKLTATSGNLRLYVDPTMHVPLGWVGDVNSLHSGDGFEANKNYYGYNEERYVHFSHGGLLATGGDAASGAFIPRLNREVIYTAEDTVGDVATINVAYRNIDQANGGWTQTTINFNRKDFWGIGYTLDVFKVCAMGDGTLRMMSRTDRNDINIWWSEDGLKWELLSADVASKYLDTFPINYESVKMDGSGDYLRLAWIDLIEGTTTNYFRTIVSGDGGASWLEPELAFTPAIVENGDSIDQHVYTMAGLRDDSGTFLLHWMDSLQRLQTGIATGTGAFVNANVTKGTGVPSAMMKAHITSVRGQDYYWLILCYYIVPTLGLVDWHRTGWEFVLFRIDPNAPLGDWYSNNYLTGSQGTIRFVPCYMNLINCHKYLSFFAGAIHATDDPSLFTADNRPIYFRLGGWDMSPIANYTDYRVESTPNLYSESDPYPLPIVGWHIPFGLVAGAGGNVSPGTPWTRTVSQVTSSYNSWRQRLSDNTGFFAQSYINELDDTAWSTTAPSDAQPTWMPTTDQQGGVVIEAEVKTEYGYDNVMISYDATIFFDVNASDHTSGVRQAVYLRVVIANNGIALIDVNAGPTPIEASFINANMAVFNRIRLSIASVNVGTYLAPSLETQVMLSLKTVSGYDEAGIREWQRVGPFTVTETTVASIIQILRFGHLPNSPGGTPHMDRRSNWRSINVFKSEERGGSAGKIKNSALSQFRAYDIDTDWPQHLRGRLITGNPINMGYAISARWGGASGFSGDNFNGLTKYQYGAENLTLPSPRLQYRSKLDLTRSSSDTFKVVLVADPDNTMTKFKWNCIAAFNSNIGNIGIRVSEDKVTWNTVVPTHQTYISRAFSPDILSMESPNKVVVRLGGGPGYMPENAEWNTSEGKPFYVNLGGTIGSPPTVFTRTANIVECIRISDTEYHLILDTDFDITLLGTLSAITVFSGRWVYKNDGIQSNRYIEITGDRDLGNATNEALSVGTIIVGIQESLEVPLEWTSTSNEQPNVTNYKTKGGLSWAYPEGPPQRTITGRLVGDVSQEQRDTLRQLLRSHTQYETRPVVLVLDDTDATATRYAPYADPDNVILGRITSGSQLDNAAWYQQTKSNSPAADIDIWKQAGDMAITLEEEV